MGALLCGHGQVASIQDCHTAGERYGFASAALTIALWIAICANIMVHFFFYDINCRFWDSFCAKNPELMAQWQRKFPEIVAALGRLHVNMHDANCRRQYGGMF